MFKRYELNVFDFNGSCVYSSSFSSINLLVKFACGFDLSLCELEGIDIVFDRTLPLEKLVDEFKGDIYGI